MTIDFDRFKAEKEGKVTPKSLTEGLLEKVDDVENLVVMTITEDGLIGVGWSTMSNLELLGLLEAGAFNAKQDIKTNGG